MNARFREVELATASLFVCEVNGVRWVIINSRLCEPMKKYLREKYSPPKNALIQSLGRAVAMF